MACALEQADVHDRRRYQRGGDWADARDRCQASCRLVLPGVRDDRCLQLRGSVAGRVELPVKRLQRPPRRFRHARLRRHLRHQFVQLAKAQRPDQTELGREAPQRVGQHGLLLDQQRAGRVQRQRALLLQALTGTNFTSGRPTRPDFANGRTASGAISCTVCPRPVSTRPQWCAAPHASSTTVHAGCASKNPIISLRRSLRLTSAFPVSFTPCTRNTALAVSSPIMVTLIADGPFCVGLNSPHSGTAMP